MSECTKDEYNYDSVLDNDDDWCCKVAQELTMMFGNGQWCASMIQFSTTMYIVLTMMYTHITMMLINSYECEISFDSVVTMCNYVTMLYIDVHSCATWCDDVY